MPTNDRPVLAKHSSRKCPRHHACVRRLLVALAEVIAAADAVLDEPEPQSDRDAFLWADTVADVKGFRWAAEVARGHVESNSPVSVRPARVA